MGTDGGVHGPNGRSQVAKHYIVGGLVALLVGAATFLGMNLINVNPGPLQAVEEDIVFGPSGCIDAKNFRRETPAKEPFLVALEISPNPCYLPQTPPIGPFDSIVPSEETVGGHAVTHIFREGNTIRGGVVVGRNVEARLVGGIEGIQVTSVNSEKQRVPETGVAAWSWNVEAVKGGTYQLRLVISVLDQEERHIVENNVFPFDVTATESKLTTIGQFLGQPWLAFVGAIALGALGLAVSVWIARRYS